MVQFQLLYKAVELPFPFSTLYNRVYPKSPLLCTIEEEEDKLIVAGGC